MSEHILDQKQIQIIIPKCCREGWDTCTHVTPKPKKKKRQIGM